MILFYVYHFWISYSTQKLCFGVLSSIFILTRLKKLKIFILEV